ncbi:MAG: HNH endonuclease [Anaerolineae bacterium]|nr:HNH endonuclease [Anaerolineae bacterium]
MNKNPYSLFEHYKQNLNLVRADPRIKMEPDRDDIVICPLCFKKWFTVENIKEKSLTLEHVPPDTLGGKGIALTCKDCNNNQGSRIDSFLVSYINDLDALQGKGEGYVDGDMKTDDGNRVRIEFRSNESGWEVLGVPKASNPKHIEFINEQFRQNRVERINLTLRITNPRRAKLALLRSAYLLAFGYLGHGFLINRNLGPLRYQFQHPEEDIFPMQAIHIFNPHEVADSFVGINALYQSPREKSYYIIFDVQRAESVTHRVGVMLPGPNSGDANFFVDLKSIKHQKSEVILNHYNVSFEDKLEFPFIAHDIWNELRTISE